MSESLYYNVKLKTIGPLFVGDTRTLQKSEYVLDRRTGEITVMNILKMFKGLKKLNLLNEYEKFVMQDSDRRTGNLFNFVKEHNLMNEYKKWSQYRCFVEKDENVGQIKTCVKDSYSKPYVPGSSLKGAIRNAMLNGELISNNKLYKNIEAQVNNEPFKGSKGYLAKPAAEMETSMGYIKDNKDDETFSIFSGLIISDSLPLSPDDIIVCGKYDMLPNASRGKQAILYRECIKPNTTIEFSVKIDKEKFNYDEKDICKALNLMYNNTKEKFLKSFNAINSDRINIKNPIYIGGGSGYVSKTAIYSLFESKESAAKKTSEILNNLFRAQRNKPLNHDLDYKRYGVSPRVRKCTKYKGSLHDFGLCSLDFQPIG